MSAVAIQEGYTNTLQLFGAVDTLVNEAVEQYLIQRVVERIRLAREKAREFERRYGQDYQTFSRRVQLDEGFYDRVKAGNPLWEQDWLAWEYWQGEVGTWMDKLHVISSGS